MNGKTPLIVRPLTPGDWSAVENLFGPKGACGGCWCMYWRVPSTGKYWDEHKGAPNRKAFKCLVESGRASGVLGFQRDAPVAWCSVGPRAEFAYLSRARKMPPPTDDRTWSVTCFFVRRQARGSGVAGDMLKAAVALARSRGASGVEGYPSAPGRVGARIPDAFAHTGVPTLFENAGFTRIADAGARRVYLKNL